MSTVNSPFEYVGILSTGGYCVLLQGEAVLLLADTVPTCCICTAQSIPIVYLNVDWGCRQQIIAPLLCIIKNGRKMAENKIFAIFVLKIISIITVDNWSLSPKGPKYREINYFVKYPTIMFHK